MDLGACCHMGVIVVVAVAAALWLLLLPNPLLPRLGVLLLLVCGESCIGCDRRSLPAVTRRQWIWSLGGGRWVAALTWGSIFQLSSDGAAGRSWSLGLVHKRYYLGFLVILCCLGSFVHSFGSAVSLVASRERTHVLYSYCTTS
jgi:hypothetical protein